MASEDGRGETGSEDPDLSLDAVLDLLAHHHRRALLRELREAPDGSIPEDAVIARLQEQEERRTGEQPSWDHVAATLHHVHEPKLAEAGVVSFDGSEETYLYYPNERLETWLDHIEAVHGSDS